MDQMIIMYMNKSVNQVISKRDVNAVNKMHNQDRSGLIATY